MGTTMNITNTDLRPAPSGARQAASPIRPGLLPHALFVAELLARRLACVAQDNFPGSAAPATLERLGTPVLVRSDPKGHAVEAFLRMRVDRPTPLAELFAETSESPVEAPAMRASFGFARVLDEHAALAR